MSRPSHYNSRYKLDLTPRQREVMDLIANGKTNAEIAGSLGLSLDGAKWHVRELLAKLEVETREEAAERWREYKHPSARMARAITGLAGLGLWKTTAAAGGVAAFSMVIFAGAITFQGATESTPGDEPPACEAQDMRMATKTEETADGLRVTLSVGLRDSDWYEGALRVLQLSDRKVESPCRLAANITVAIHLLGPLADARPSVTAPIVPIGFAPTVSENPTEVPVALTLQEGMQAAILVAEFSNWCLDEAALGIQFGVPDAYVPGAYQGFGAPLANLPPCIDDASPPALSVKYLQ